MYVDDAALVGLKQHIPDNAHIPSQAHQGHLLLIKKPHYLSLVRRLGRIALRVENESPNAPGLSLGNHRRPRLIADHQRHPRIQTSISARIGNRL